MAIESFKLALKEIEKRRQNALFEANNRNDEVCAKIHRIKELNILLSQTGLQLSRVIFSQGKNAKCAIDRIMAENLKNQKELEVLLTLNNYPKDYLDIQYFCKKCEDSGYIDGMKCECLKQQVTKYNVLEFNSANKIDTSSFDTFSLKYYSDIKVENSKSCKETMSDIFSFCKQYVAMFNKNSPSVLMLGDTGLGKTHLSLAIARTVMQSGFSALYSSAPDLFRRLQNEYYGKGEQGVDTMETILKADLVIIDDLGAEMENQFNISTLYNLMNMRLNANKPIIISTNLTLKQIENRYTDRVASRIMTLYKCLKFVGKDVRQIKLKNNEI
ncbi:MAG: ATP-binding protein [Oscillospiraceae bacterium]